MRKSHTFSAWRHYGCTILTGQKINEQLVGVDCRDGCQVHFDDKIRMPSCDAIVTMRLVTCRAVALCLPRWQGHTENEQKSGHSGPHSAMATWAIARPPRLSSLTPRSPLGPLALNPLYHPKPFPNNIPPWRRRLQTRNLLSLCPRLSPIV